MTFGFCQLAGTYNYDTCFQFHRWRTQTESEPYLYRTWTEHDPNFLTFSEPEQNRTLIIRTGTQNYGFFSISNGKTHSCVRCSAVFPSECLSVSPPDHAVCVYIKLSIAAKW